MTGPYEKNGGKYTLYGSADSGGLPLSQYGFYAGTDPAALKRMLMGHPEQFDGGSFSMSVSLPVQNGGTIYLQGVCYRRKQRRAPGKHEKDRSGPA